MAQLDVDVNFNMNNLEELQTASDLLNQLNDSAEQTKGPVDDVGDSSEQTGSQIKQMGDDSKEASSDVNLLGDALSAVASLGLAAEFNNTAMAADKYNISMAALNQVAGNNNISLSATSAAIKQVTDATSIGGGQARSYFTMLMNLGVTNTNALAQSMIALKGQSAITGNSIEQMSTKLTTVVNGTSLSARSLTNLGLSLQQLAETNGMSVEQIKSSWATMTADEKLQALNNAMAENSSLVTTMNQTTSEQLQEVQNSWAALEITVGQSSTVANQYILGLANGGIQTLNYAVQNIPFASTVAAGAMAFGSLATGIKPAVDTFNSLSMSVRNGIDIMKSFGSGVGTAVKMVNALRNAETLSEGVSAALAVVKGTETAAEGANAAAKSAAIAPTTGLAIAENTLLLPILLVTVAIIALIAVLVYLYNNNETVRKSINNLISIFKQVASVIIGVVVSAFNKARSIINTVKSTVTSLGNAIRGTLVGAWNSLSGAVNSALGPLRSAWNTLNSIASAARSVPSSVLSIFSGVEFGNFNVGYEGFSGGTLNDGLSSGISNTSSNVTVNNNFNGIIENDAKEWAVNAINERLTRENLIRGV